MSYLSAKLFIIVTIFNLLLVTNYAEGRYLPTRGHGDNLEKLRELMYQILESSDENAIEQPQQQQPISVQQQQQQQQSPQQRLAGFNGHHLSSSWLKQNLADGGDLPQLFGLSKSRFGSGNRFYDSERLYS